MITAEEINKDPRMPAGWQYKPFELGCFWLLNPRGEQQYIYGVASTVEEYVNWAVYVATHGGAEGLESYFDEVERSLGLK